MFKNGTIAIRMAKFCAITLLTAGLTHTALADKQKPGKVIAGWIETIVIPDADTKVDAKLDSGAVTSSMHALNIEPFKRDDKNWVRFTMDLVEDGEPVTVERPVVRTVRIRSHDGNHDRRYVVNLDLCFDAREYTTQFTLADRTQFDYPILLGRRFLSGLALIDSENRYLTQASCAQKAGDDKKSKAE